MTANPPKLEPTTCEHTKGHPKLGSFVGRLPVGRWSLDEKDRLVDTDYWTQTLAMVEHAYWAASDDRKQAARRFNNMTDAQLAGEVPPTKENRAKYLQLRSDCNITQGRESALGKALQALQEHDQEVDECGHLIREDHMSGCLLCSLLGSD